MNQAEKEAYLREYSILKNQGKPFFPYIVAKDSAMAVIVMLVIIFLVADVRRRARPEGRPDHDHLRPAAGLVLLLPLRGAPGHEDVPKFTPMATIGVPTICMILLFLLPFYDRSPERQITRRPIALASGVTVIAAMAFLTYSGAHTGSPNSVDLPPPSYLTAAERPRSTRASWSSASRAAGLSRDRRERQQRPRPVLTHIGSMLRPAAIASTLRNPTRADAVLPDLAQQDPTKFQDLVTFLSDLQ